MYFVFQFEYPSQTSSGCHSRNPVPDQEPIEFKSNDSDQYNYWDITNEGIVLKPNLYKSQMDFWDAIVGINQTFDKNNFVWELLQILLLSIIDHCSCERDFETIK